jgi:H+/Cl- antiporter ClcA
MGWVVELPRFARIVVCALFGVAVTALLTPLVDSIYMQRFFSQETVMLPALISTAVGFIVYVVGWRVFVGYAGERPRFTRALLAYLAFGVFVTVFALSLFILGLTRQ